MGQTEPLYRAAQVAAFDRRAIDEHGIEGYALMRRAAAAAYAALRAEWPGARRIVVFAGAGNNGGDGVELARLARADGLEVCVHLLCDPARLRGEAAQAWQAFTAAGGGAGDFDGQIRADVIVDALLGTGLSKPVRDDYASAITAINAAEVAGVLAIDIPSGLSADTGAVLGEAVRADLTISFIGRKLGLYTGQGPALCGRRLFDDLAVPAEVMRGDTPAAHLLMPALVAVRLPPRHRTAHKNAHGHVLCIGGDEGMSGAIRLCAESALRAGAGLVSVATRRAHAALLTQQRPEIMARACEAPLDLEVLLGRAQVIAAGPGFGQGPWAESLMPVLLRAGLPLVLDADALNWLSRHGAENRLPEDTVLTPHPGEAARLLQTSAAAIEEDRPAAAGELARRHGCVVVLKGAGSLIADPGGTLHVCEAGNPGMAVAGMGDILCGIIAALRGQGLNARDAACVGVEVHARAGDIVAAADGERGLLPSDLLPAVRHLVNPCPTSN